MLSERTRTISITSGKGGVGKSTLVSNMAYFLSTQGKKVLVFDGDLGMANIDIMFGVRSQKSIVDVIQGRCDISDILMEVSENIWLIPGGSGVRDYNHLNAFERRALLDSVSRLHFQFDFLLIDTAPGIAENVLYLNSAAQIPVVVITPDPSSLTDSYALIKVLNQVHKVRQFSIICNQVRDEKEGRDLFVRFSEVIYKFLDVSVDYAGSIPSDASLQQANHKQRLIMRQDPNAISAQAIQAISLKLGRSQLGYETKGGLQFFWEQLVGVA